MGIFTSKSKEQPLLIEKKQCKRWFNLKGNEFEESEDLWYNLLTCRFIKQKPNYNPVLSIRGIRILGTMENILDFWKLNLSRLGQTLPKGTEFDNVIFNPFEDIEFLSRDASDRSQACFSNMLNSTIPIAQTMDVEKLSDDFINKICRFSFSGLFVKGKVVNIIDGDTLDVVIFVPMGILSAARKSKLNDDLHIAAIPTKGFEKNGFFARIRIRMYGYDAAEKNTKAGKCAKELLEEKISSLKNIVWCQFIETSIATEKYDRVLAVLYEDENKTTILNDYLFRRESETGIKMVFPYLGKTKKKFDSN